MKKCTILFLVLILVLSLASCTSGQTDDNMPETTVAGSLTGDTTVSETSTSSGEHKAEVDDIIRWLERNMTSVRGSDGYGGLRVELYSDTKIEIRNLLCKLPETQCTWVSIEKLCHEDDGYFQIGIGSDTDHLSYQLKGCCLENHYDASFFVKGLNVISFLDSELKNIPDESKPTIKLLPCGNGYTEVEITFE